MVSPGEGATLLMSLSWSRSITQPLHLLWLAGVQVAYPVPQMPVVQVPRFDWQLFLFVYCVFEHTPAD